jgi:hypothetical protein
LRSGNVGDGGDESADTFDVSAKESGTKTDVRGSVQNDRAIRIEPELETLRPTIV